LVKEFAPEASTEAPHWRVEVTHPDWMGVQLAIPETSLVVVTWEEVQRRQEHLTN
jgi:hypothetical protein